jgi:polysaccharide chain length determinant protein (PEP-CTERM system associated)
VNEIASVIYGFARTAWRRRKVAMITAWAVALGVWSVTMLLRDRYEAKASVLVDMKSSLQPVLTGIAIETDYGSQLERVRNALLATPQLTAVAIKTNLDKDVKSAAELEALVAKLQEQIKVISIAPESSAKGPSSNTIYSIFYQHHDRQKSVEVVREVLRAFEEGTMNGNRGVASEQGEFIDGQIADALKTLQDQESQIAEFQKRNLDMLPGQKGDYFARYEQESRGLADTKTDLAIAGGRLEALRKELAGTPKYLVGSTVAGASDITTRRLDAERKLEELLRVYTEKNTEVIAQRRTIDELRQKEEKDRLDLQRGGEGSSDTAKSINPNWQQLQGQLSQIQQEISALESKANQHRKQIALLDGQIDKTPEIQKEYQQLTRDVSSSKQAYEALLAKKQMAKISDDAAKSGPGEFDILEPPRADPMPVWPSRPIFILGGLIAALGLGLGLAILPQLVAPTVNDLAALQRQFGFPVLGSVSALRDASVAKRERHAVRNTAIGVGALVVVAAVLVVTSGTISAMLQN